jgi:hypothetical protein
MLNAPQHNGYAGINRYRVPKYKKVAKDSTPGTREVINQLSEQSHRDMHLLTWLTATLTAGFVSPASATFHKTFANRPIFTPPNGTRVSYPRVVELSDGTILATISWRNPDTPQPYFPIYASKDGGWTWKHISNLTDQVKPLRACRARESL